MLGFWLLLGLVVGEGEGERLGLKNTADWMA